MARKYTKEQIEEARRRERKEGIYGVKSIESLIDLGPSFMKLNKQERAHVVRKLSLAANKRIARMKKENLESPALKYWERSGGIEFNPKGLTANELVKEYIRVRSFLQMETSSIKGFKKFTKEYEKRTGMVWGSKESNLFWDIYNTIKDLHPSAISQYGSEQVQNTIDIVLERTSSDDIIKLAHDVYDELNKGKDDSENILDYTFELGPNI